MLSLTLLLGAAPPDVCLVTLDGTGSPEGKELARRVVKKVLGDSNLSVRAGPDGCSDANACVTRAARAMGAAVGLAVTVVSVDVRAFVDLEAHVAQSGATLGTATFVQANGKETVSAELLGLVKLIRDELARQRAAAQAIAPLTASDRAAAPASQPGATRSLKPRTLVSWVVTGGLALTAGAFTAAGLVAEEELEAQRDRSPSGFRYRITRAHAASLVGTVNLSFTTAWISAVLTVLGIGLSTALTLLDLSEP